MSDDDLKILSYILFEPLFESLCHSDIAPFFNLIRNIDTTIPNELFSLFFDFSRVITERSQFYKNDAIDALKEYHNIISENQSNKNNVEKKAVMNAAMFSLSRRVLEDLRLFSRDDQIQHYIDICKNYNFNLKNSSHFTANKCIIDPLGYPVSDITNIRIDVSEVNDWMLNELKKNPTDLYQLSSRRFEELIAEILIRKGYEVELTSATRDGGKDIYAARKDDIGSFLYIVECKKYNPDHKVGVSVLRDLYGVLSKERATYGVAVTTSYFSKPAQEFQKDIQFQMSLQDFDSIKKWLCDVT